MNLDSIDRALRDEPTITPTIGFDVRVMRAVRAQAEAREGLTFPWARLVPGLVACGVLTLVGLIATALGQGSAPADFGWTEAMFEASSTATTATWLAATLIGSCLIVWGSMRLTDPGR